jgi:hypothetical protein
MVAGISGATPGSASGDGLDDNDGSVLLQAPRKIVSADAVAKLATVRALRKLIIAFPRAIPWQFLGNSLATPVKQPTAKRLPEQ